MRTVRFTPSWSTSYSRTNPSCLSVSAREIFSLEAGMSVKSCRAVRALRIRVSMSAIGSVTMVLVLPAGLLDSRQVALQGKLAEADAAEREGAKESSGPAAAMAAVAVPNLELRRLAERPFVERFPGHCISSIAGRTAYPVAPAAACPPRPSLRRLRCSPGARGYGRS